MLLERCLELLEPALAGERPVHVDATLGLGGHAEAVLAANPRVRLIGLDRDPEALARSRAAAGARTGTGSTWCTPSTTSCPTCSAGWN